MIMATTPRPDRLSRSFEAFISPDQFREWCLDRWPGLKMAIPLVSSLATHSRAELLDRVRKLVELPVNDDGADGLVTIRQTTENVVEFCRAMVEILEAVQSRLMLVADDLLIEHGHASILAETQSFDPADWIERATEAGATMFVRDDELWIGSVIAAGKSEAIERLKDELDDERKAAVRDVLASRGLICAEA
jgi:hypothetical protein